MSDQNPLVAKIVAAMKIAAPPKPETPTMRRPVVKPNLRTSLSLATPPMPLAQAPTMYGTVENTSAAAVNPRPLTR
jgi:hypothetical protein